MSTDHHSKNVGEINPGVAFLKQLILVTEKQLKRNFNTFELSNFFFWNSTQRGLRVNSSKQFS